MHYNNRQWLLGLKRDHPDWFTGGQILELGSGGAEPFIRELFDDPEIYVGVDIVEGPNVDVVVNAGDMDFGKTRFSLTICFSMLEHDPEWRKSLTNAKKFMKSGSRMIGCHGAEGNQHHGPEPWKIVPHEEFIFFVEEIGFHIEDAFFEEEIYGPDCTGAFDWILRKP